VEQTEDAEIAERCRPQPALNKTQHSNEGNEDEDKGYVTQDSQRQFAQFGHTEYPEQQGDYAAP
jgi:hypothetical protein